METTSPTPAPDPQPAPKCKLVKAGPAPVIPEAPVQAPARLARVDDPKSPAFAAKEFVIVSRRLGPRGVQVQARDNLFVLQVPGQLPFACETALELRAFCQGYLRGASLVPDPRVAAASESSGGESEEKKK